MNNETLFLPHLSTKIVHNMSTIQLKVTISDRLQALLKNQAEQIGLSMAAYVKNLIIEDIKKNDWPTHIANKEVERSYARAIKNKKTAIKVNDLNDFFNNL